MKFRSKAIRTLGLVLFAVGVLVGLAYYAIATWGDLEAFLFDRAVSADAGLPGLRCPVAISRPGSGTVSAPVKNPTDRTIRPTVRIHISEGFFTLMGEEEDRLSLEPGESQRVEWPVTDENAAYGRLVLARVLVKYPYPLKDRTSACGIFVIGLPGMTSGQITALAVGVSLLAMVIGMALWVVTSRPLRGRTEEAARAMGALVVVILGGILSTLLGAWLVTGLLVLLAVLLIGAILAYFLRRA